MRAHATQKKTFYLGPGDDVKQTESPLMFSDRIKQDWRKSSGRSGRGRTALWDHQLSS
jgi:hypothetical protein